LARLLKLIKEGVISGKIAKVVFEDMAKTGKAPDKIVKEKGLVQVTDASAIEEIILNVLADNAKEVNDYRNGKTKLLGFFVGQVMKKTKGKANPKIVNEVLKEKLKK
ncbi:MAG: Asp-tRNA(Asn)/Glu-tRNA(Gln) amidotransferase GatCAB subunit B, partial [Proteobacteria bacterium]|nr:Asp-tRNA(Asn)/Glu-tRNA(Gln) amidotransferase GatCAB subunit B [Pseudomonadota bacterium]MBU4100396.1 Asp-tRNA(Asn)/Glu-tRNA(Gln) amidotransferase GatCAB subunit B [Pseudomonadota bacterium]